MEANMQEALDQEISTKEMEKLLNISGQTVYSLVKKEEVVPINKNNWTIDGTYYFSPETVEKVKEMYRKPGLTNKDIAEMLQVSLSTAQKLIKTGKIPSFTAFYLGKPFYMISPFLFIF
ncbi:helix-turn-helix domain-containing protein [Bacillus sp. OTU530]|uniref:helix-turn-helix domain-containing protein n=1 Tax=Bacillus sp. OTU530 TaxID=3043862 RepID=UPI00313BC738